MPYPFNWLAQILSPALKPLVRLIIGFLAIPLIRFMRTRFRPNQEWDEELEKDIDQWFRASMVLFLATKNVEEQIAYWFSQKQIEIDLDSNWMFAAGRLLLAIGVIESMPDHHLFSIIHPGPKPLRWVGGIGLVENVRLQLWPFFRGLLCMHLNRSSPVFAILAVIFSGHLGWVFFLLAITQYLIIGLVTSQDKAVDVLTQFDHEVARQRETLVKEFNLNHPHEQAHKQPLPAVQLFSAAPPAKSNPLDEHETSTQS